MMSHLCGRDAGCPTPPAQSRTCRVPASGSAVGLAAAPGGRSSIYASARGLRQARARAGDDSHTRGEARPADTPPFPPTPVAPLHGTGHRPVQAALEGVGVARDAIVALMTSHPRLAAVAAGVARHLPMRLPPCRAPVARSRPCRARGAAVDPRHALSVVLPRPFDASNGAPACQARRTAAEAPEAGLLRGALPGELPPSRRARRGEPCRLAADPTGADQSVGVAAAHRRAATVGLDHVCTPQGQRLRPRDVGHHGRADPPVRDPGVRVAHPALRLQPPGLQPRPEPAQQGPGIAAQPPQPPPPVRVPGVANAVTIGLSPSAIPPVWPVPGPVTDRRPGPAAGPVSSTTPHNLRLVARVQEAGAGRLEPRGGAHREAAGPRVAVALRPVGPPPPRRPGPRLLEPLHHGRDSGLPVVGRPLPRHAIPAAGRGRVPGVPAVQQELDVQAAGAGPTAGPRVGVRRVCSPPPGGWRAACRSAGVRRQGPGRAASFRHVLPPVRGVPPLSGRGVLRRPNGLRRAFPVTVLLHRPVERSPSRPRCRPRAVAGLPRLCLQRRRPAGDAAPSQEPGGPPKVFAVSLPAGRGLGPPAALRRLAKAAALVSPAGCVKPLGVRPTRVSTRYPHCRGRGHPYGLQAARSPLRPSCAPWWATTPPWTHDSRRVGGEP